MVYLWLDPNQEGQNGAEETTEIDSPVKLGYNYRYIYIYLHL